MGLLRSLVFRLSGIRRVYVHRVSIAHKHGASRLGFHDMPKEWQRQFMFTAAEVALATAEERKRDLAVRAKSENHRRKAQKILHSEAEKREIASLRRKIASLQMKYSTASLEASLARNKVSYQQNLRRSRTYSRSSYSYRYYNTGTGAYYRTSYRPRYRITHNGSKSVPGSLETWEQRAIRYERAKARYASQLASLRARLAAKDPGYVPSPLVPR